MSTPTQESTTRRTEALAVLIEIIAEETGVDCEYIREDSNLASDMGCDSFDAFLIKQEVENEFSIEIPREAMEKCHTVGDYLDYILAHSKWGL